MQTNNNSNMKEIKFSDLKNYNDSNSIIIAGVDVDGLTIEEIDDLMHKNWGLLPETKHVTGMAHIYDNVLGEDGRTDVLFELSGEGIANPMVRMMIRTQGLGLMWTSDFIDNYANDYLSEVC